ncbi:uncharacterized protein LOC142224602 [Haematobia irritans]|uniref:uncharacterized protein LOC142224602 n=1 Tax=Haematobia irritans TaxID=7368 RepID=UPI003F4FC0E0
MGLIDNIEPYLPGENFNSWVARVEQFFVVNDVNENKQVPLFVTLIGAETYEILASLTVPLKPKDKSISKLLKILTDHFAPKANEIAERYKFYSYIVELKALAATCNFKSFLKEALRDRLVCGVNSSSLRTKLLEEPLLTWDKVTNLATADSLTQKHVISMQREFMSENVKYISERGSEVNKNGKYFSAKDRQERQQNCDQCGRQHMENQCRVKNFVCFYCSRKGHIASKCWKKRRDNYNKVTINSIIGKNISCTVQLNVNNVIMKFEVDTGAAVTVVPETYLQELLPNISIRKCDVELRSFGGNLISVLGQTEVDVKEMQLPLIVVR